MLLSVIQHQKKKKLTGIETVTGYTSRTNRNKMTIQ